MRIAITGATGFVGKSLTATLLAAGHEVVALTRDAERARRSLPARCRVETCDPERGTLDPAALDGVDAVVNLAGAGVADGRWTARRKETIWRSRVDGTRALVASIAVLPKERRPRVLLSASAVGYYGDRGDPELTETSSPGTGFLAEICRAWEREALAAEAHGVRVVVMRLGVVLGPNGGALARMLPPFRLGLGGRLGDGRQWISWIHEGDLAALFAFALARDDVRGPMNAVAPNPVTNAELTTTLARALGTPALVPAPAFALKLALGEMATVLLDGQRALPAVAEGHGFRFRHPALAGALTDVTADPATTLEMEQWVPRPPAEVFAFFGDAHNLERITPPFLKFRILGVSTPRLQSGTRIDYQLSLHGVPVRWQSLIENWEPNRMFADTQTRGPYRRWEHTHEFEAHRDGTIIHDRIRYELPLGALGGVVAGGFVGKDLARIFAFRYATIREIFG